MDTREQELRTPLTPEVLPSVGGAEQLDGQPLKGVDNQTKNLSTLELGFVLASVGMALVASGLAARNPGGYSRDFEEAERQRRLEQQRREELRRQDQERRQRAAELKRIQEENARRDAEQRERIRREREARARWRRDN